MRDERRLTTDRYFGDLDTRLSNLEAALEYIADNNPSEEELTEWILETTNAQNQTGVERRLRFLETIDLLERASKHYSLTTRAEEFLQTGDTRVIFEGLQENVKGFKQLLNALLEQPLSEEEFREVLAQNEEFEGGQGVASRHREWLQILDFVTEAEDDRYQLTKQGYELATEIADDEVDSALKESNNSQTTLTSSVSSWRDTVREEIIRYHKENDTVEFQLQDFVEFAELTIRERFPDNQTWEASVRRNLQELRDRDEIEFLGNGSYRINKAQFQSYFDDPTIYLAPGAGEVSKKHFEKAARTGIPRETYQDFTDLDLGKTARVWGGFPDHQADVWEEVEPGDYVFFYRGDGYYGDAAKVVDTELNHEFAEYLWPQFVGEPGSDEEREGEWIHLVYIEDIERVEIPSEELHSLVDFDQKYPPQTSPLDDSAVESIRDKYESIEMYIKDYVRNRRVWVEKTQMADRDYKQEGELQLGNAIMAPSRDQGGRKRYEELREADVGDIVLHLLQDQHQFVGVSVIKSELTDDFSGPPDDRWTEEQQEQGGYLRWLSDYEGIEPHIHVYDDLLENPKYTESLRQIRENSEKIFYDKRLSFNQGHYFTRCPDDLVELLAEESYHLQQLLEERGYEFESSIGLPPADSYGGIKEATEDVRARLDHADEVDSWPTIDVAQSIVRDWTEALRRVDLIEGDVSPTDRVKCEQIVQLYEENDARLEEIVESVESGTIENSNLTAGQVVFVTSLRGLQEESGVTPNLNHVKFRQLLRGVHNGRGGDELVAPDARPRDAETIERQLQNTGQLVFYGPPGTGKTYTAQRFARWWLNQQSNYEASSNQLETVTFHPSFSYEDFLEGLTAEADDGAVEYNIKDGVFKRICNRAEQAYHHAQQNEDVDEPPRFVLIIDEINRGNLAQIFGETITLLEADKRLGEEDEVEITLAHSGESFAVPPNLYVIGTMNTADRSIALVDAALRRRFRFVSFPPNYTALIDYYDGFKDLEDVRETAQTEPDPYRSLVALSILALRELNDQIVDTPDLGKGKQIGHSYLMGPKNVSEVLDAWRYEILPLLEEYYFGQFDRIREELFRGGGDRLFRWEMEEIADFTADDLRRTLATLEGISLAEPETETEEDTQNTLDLLIDKDVLEPGDELVFNESKVPSEADQPYDSSEHFWRCVITGKTSQSDGVKWLYNDEEYSFSGLAQTIIEQVSKPTGPVNGLNYWRHPSFDNQRLADLRTEMQSGELAFEEQTTD